MRNAILCAALLAAACSGKPAGEGKTLKLATTTSVVDSGLLDQLLPAFQKAKGYKVEVASLGSGKAIDELAAGHADVAVTHSPGVEEAALKEGKLASRTPFMENTFVIVGPKDSEAAIAGAGTAADAMKRIAASGKPFISRADGSGTNTREKELWKAAGIPADSAFIVQAKTGMGKTLEMAAEKGGYTLADRGTYMATKAKTNLVILFQGDAALVNRYSVLLPKNAGDGARAFADFLRAPETRALIGGYGVEKVGEPLFTPLAQ